MHSKKMKKTQIKFYILALALFLGGFHVAFAADIEQNIISQVNQERAKNGLSILQENEALSKAAFLKAQDMIGNNYFAHTSPGGLDPWHWLEEVGYQYKFAGENLAMDFTSASSVHKAWMKSASHKENILSENYSEIGIAVLDGIIENRERKVAVQFFGAPLNEERAKTVSAVTDKFDTSVKISEASVQPWEGTLNDEMLVYARIEGNPAAAEVYVGGKHFELQELQKDKFMNIVPLENIDLRKDVVMIKAGMGDEQALFYQVPQEQYFSYLMEKEEPKQELAVAAAQKTTQLLQNKQITTQSMVLAGIMMVCVVLIVNVWILEKEEEKLLEACGAQI